MTSAPHANIGQKKPVRNHISHITNTTNNNKTATKTDTTYVALFFSYNWKNMKLFFQVLTLFLLCIQTLSIHQGYFKLLLKSYTAFLWCSYSRFQMLSQLELTRFETVKYFQLNHRRATGMQRTYIRVFITNISCFLEWKIKRSRFQLIPWQKKSTNESKVMHLNRISCSPTHKHVNTYI